MTIKIINYKNLHGEQLKKNVLKAVRNSNKNISIEFIIDDALDKQKTILIINEVIFCSKRIPSTRKIIKIINNSK